ncbi:MAG: tripartite tricarboxylate transporter substrate binding protein [Paralcaligenes sp.]
MKTLSKKFVSVLGALAILSLASGTVLASEPPITIVVPYSPGGPTDIISRIVGKALGDELQRSVIIDNRAGASGIIGSSIVARSKPDGTTLLVNSSIQEVLPSISSKMPYDTAKDFTPIGLLVNVPLVLAVTNSLPVKSVKELRAYIAAHPDKVNVGNPGVGSSDQLAAGLFRMLTNLKTQDISYKGSSPAITDLIGGQIQMMFDAGPSIMPFVKKGNLRGLATSGAIRSKAIPDLPTMEEAGVHGFDLVNWYGMWGPAGMDPKISHSLIEALQKVMKLPAVEKQLNSLGAEPAHNLYGSAFKKFGEQEREKLGKIAKAANIKLN